MPPKLRMVTLKLSSVVLDRLIVADIFDEVRGLGLLKILINHLTDLNAKCPSDGSATLPK